MNYITIRGFALSCLCYFFLLCCGTAFAQESATLAGTIRSESNEALEGVTILLENTNTGTLTDGQGQFEISNLAAGSYTLVVTSVGFENTVRIVNLAAGERKQVNFELRSSVTSLSEIMVRGEALDPRNRTITVNEIDQQQIRLLNVDHPIRLIEQIPGVDLLSYNQGGVADQFSIRGFGGGGHEGQAGAQIDGVSLNEAEGHADGYADLNILIPLNLESVKVYKGPSSVLFGRFAEGGTLAMETRKGGNYQDVSLSAGSYRTVNAQYALGKGIEVGNQGRELQTNLALQFYQSDGYQANSDYLRGNFSGRVGYQLTDKTDVALSARGHSSQWDASGYTSEARINDRKLRREQQINGENDGGAKQFYSQRVDINHNITDSMRLLVFGYAVQQDFTRFAKFGVGVGGQSERFNTRDVYAAGASLNGKHSFGTVRMDYVAGAEFYTEETSRKRWRSSNRVRGEQIQERDFDLQTVSLFAQGEFNVHPLFRPSIGLRYDKFFGSFNSNDPGQTPFSNSIGKLSNVTPKLGLRSTIYDGLDLRASASNGFSIPNSADKYNEQLDLKPVQLWQYELGASYTGISWLELDAVGFILNTSNEILESPPGSGDLVNVGKTMRSGIETEVVVKPVTGLRVRGTFSYITTSIEENPDELLLTKELVNIPQTIGTVDVSYALQSGLGARLMLRNVGPYFTNSDNTAGYDGYTVTNLTLFYNFDQVSSNRGRVFAEVRNLFDAQYSETVFGNVGSQIFTPAPTRNLTVGVIYSF